MNACYKHVVFALLLCQSGGLCQRGGWFGWERSQAPSAPRMALGRPPRPPPILSQLQNAHLLHYKPEEWGYSLAHACFKMCELESDADKRRMLLLTAVSDPEAVQKAERSAKAAKIIAHAAAMVGLDLNALKARSNAEGKDPVSPAWRSVVGAAHWSSLIRSRKLQLSEPSQPEAPQMSTEQVQAAAQQLAMTIAGELLSKGQHMQCW